MPRQQVHSCRRGHHQNVTVSMRDRVNTKVVAKPPSSELSFLNFLDLKKNQTTKQLTFAPAMPTTTIDYPKMTYRFLGNSGLLVSKLGLGQWMFFDPNHTVDAWYEVMRTAFEHGINFFDSAEVYADGYAEVLLGGAIKKGVTEGIWAREDLVITSKIFSGTTFDQTKLGPNDQGASRKHLVEGIKRSLKKLELEYVDVIYCHRSEKYTPIEETVRAMNFIINQGWALYWGTSEWSPADIKEACDIADRLHLIRPVVEQPEYSILERSKVGFHYADLIKTNKLGLTTWSPLSYGILTGKYNRAVLNDTRLANSQARGFVSNFDEKVEMARQLEPIAAKLGCSMAQMSIAWCVSNENVSTVMLGARNSAQLEETIRALEFVDKITPEIKAEIDKVVKFVPKLWEPDYLYTLRGRHL